MFTPLNICLFYCSVILPIFQFDTIFCKKPGQETDLAQVIVSLKPKPMSKGSTSTHKNVPKTTA